MDQPQTYDSSQQVMHSILYETPILLGIDVAKALCLWEFLELHLRLWLDASLRAMIWTW